MAHAIAIGLRSRRGTIGTHAANALSASRFVLAALWLAAFVDGYTRPEVLGPIALAAALSDIADGPLARQMCCADRLGRWLDNIADIVFVLTALLCEARAGAIPTYIPILIAASFAQYAIDSIFLSGDSVPVRSRIGHWGGIINYGLVLLLAFASGSQWSAVPVGDLSPLLAAAYFAAIIERAKQYPGAPSHAPAVSSAVNSRLARGR
jgi:phosphatidylglycerophosphate synthase